MVAPTCHVSQSEFLYLKCGNKVDAYRIHNIHCDELFGTIRLKRSHGTWLTITEVYLKAIIKIVGSELGRLKLKMIINKFQTLKDWGGGGMFFPKYSLNSSTSSKQKGYVDRLPERKERSLNSLHNANRNIVVFTVKCHFKTLQYLYQMEPRGFQYSFN